MDNIQIYTGPLPSALTNTFEFVAVYRAEVRAEHPETRAFASPPGGSLIGNPNAQTDANSPSLFYAARQQALDQMVAAAEEAQATGVELLADMNVFLQQPEVLVIGHRSSSSSGLYRAQLTLGVEAIGYRRKPQPR